MVNNAQEWLDKNKKYKWRKTSLLVLDISNENLVGSLSLTDFVKLEELDCSGNLLTELGTLLNSCNIEKLTKLNISNNKFSAQELTIFSKLTNLKKLNLAGNSFFGSLNSLESLTKLEELDISDTNICKDNTGKEFAEEEICLNLNVLPASLKKIYCENTIITEELKNCKKKSIRGNKEYYDLQAWRKAQQINFPSRISFSSSVSSPTSTSRIISNVNSSSLSSPSSLVSLPSSMLEISSVSSESREEEIIKKLIDENKRLTTELERVKQLLQTEKDKNSLKDELRKYLEINLIKENNYRNILIIGRTGNGKSTLANVLTNRREINREKITEELTKKGEKCYKCKEIFIEGKNEEGKDSEVIEAMIEEKEPFLFHKECFNFKESDGSVSKTKYIQVEEFEYESIKYRIIDTPGFGDAKLSEKEILSKIAKVAYLTRDGINQILFVVGGRFDKDHIGDYDSSSQAIFSRSTSKYITVVRTRFKEFTNEIACENDRLELIQESPVLTNILNTSKIIYIDSLGSAERNVSRRKLLKHLQESCQEVYKPQKLDELNAKISQHIQKVEELQKSPEREENIEQIKQEEEAICKETKQFMEQKIANWRKWMNTVSQVTGAAASIAALTVAVACRIM